MITKKTNNAKVDAKMTFSKSVDRLKNIKFTSGKPEEIKEAEFKLSF